MKKMAMARNEGAKWGKRESGKNVRCDYSLLTTLLPYGALRVHDLLRITGCPLPLPPFSPIAACQTTPFSTALTTAPELTKMIVSLVHSLLFPDSAILID